MNALLNKARKIRMLQTHSNLLSSLTTRDKCKEACIMRCSDGLELQQEDICIDDSKLAINS